MTKIICICPECGREKTIRPEESYIFKTYGMVICLNCGKEYPPNENIDAEETAMKRRTARG